MKKKVKKILVFSIGVIFIILGLLGLFLPFLQGIIFLAVGFILLFSGFPKIQLWANKHTEKFPSLHKGIQKIEIWLKNIIGEI
jgi:uncharacterized membrane protein YbaN (DUF454 family)